MKPPRDHSNKDHTIEADKAALVNYFQKILLEFSYVSIYPLKVTIVAPDPPAF